MSSLSHPPTGPDQTGGPPHASPPAPSGRGHGWRRSLEALGGLALVMAALPGGLLVNLVLHRIGSSAPDEANAAGFAATLVFAAVGTVLGWHARQRIRRQLDELRGITTATLAMLIGLCILLACAVVMLKMIAAAR